MHHTTLPPRRKTLLLAALLVSAAAHAGLIFTPAFPGFENGPAPAPQTVALIPVAPLAPSPPEPPAPQAEPEPEPEAAPEPPPAPKPEPKPEAAPEPPAPTPPTAPQAAPAPAPAPRPAPPPATASSSPPPTPTPAPGTFAGAREGQPGPSLRIDWGSPAQALALVRTGGMQLAVADTRPGRGLVQGVHLDPAGHAARTALPTTVHLDPEARLVGQSPAFAPLAAALQLQPHERLVLLLPRNLAAQVRQAQRQAVHHAGYRWEQIAVTAGRFVSGPSGPRLQVTRLFPAS